MDRAAACECRQAKAAATANVGDNFAGLECEPGDGCLPHRTDPARLAVVIRLEPRIINDGAVHVKCPEEPLSAFASTRRIAVQAASFSHWVRHP